MLVGVVVVFISLFVRVPLWMWLWVVVTALAGALPAACIHLIHPMWQACIAAACADMQLPLRLLLQMLLSLLLKQAGHALASIWAGWLMLA